MNIESTSLWIGLALLCSCQSRQQVTAPVSTIDSTLQTNATAILESKLLEINAQSGQVIITLDLHPRTTDKIERINL